MKPGLKSYAMAAVGCVLLFGNVALALGTPPAAALTETITYQHSSMRGREDIVITPDGTMHYSQSGKQSKKEIVKQIEDSEIKELQAIVQSKEFMSLDSKYITTGIRDGSQLSVTANGKTIEVSNHKSPPALLKLVTAIGKLEAKYVEAE